MHRACTVARVGKINNHQILRVMLYAGKLFAIVKLAVCSVQVCTSRVFYLARRLCSAVSFVSIQVTFLHVLHSLALRQSLTSSAAAAASSLGPFCWELQTVRHLVRVLNDFVKLARSNGASLRSSAFMSVGIGMRRWESSSNRKGNVRRFT